LVFETKDTIAAISTPPGHGGIGVIRISGPEAESIARKLFRRTGSKNLKSNQISPPFIPRKVHYGHIYSPNQKDKLDEALVIFMPAPNSYTTEDVVEIQIHGGAVSQKSILEAVLDTGARLAEPGEFTKRAFLGGRIDLCQAEAVIDVIQAKTETALKVANRQMEGVVGESAKRIKNNIIELYAMMEAEIEFPEDMEGVDQQKEIYLKPAQDIVKSLERILKGYRKGCFLREGLRMILVGRVNVGKSSLLNRFLERERALVTEYPGTTRDSIEEMLDIKGMPVFLVDTAGWRNTLDPVEKMGIERAGQLAENADLILFLVDAGEGIIPEDEEIYTKFRNQNKILVINKIDLLKGNKKVETPKEWKFFEKMKVSVKYEKGIEALKNAIYRFGTEEGVEIGNDIIPNVRQKKLFEKALSATMAARDIVLENRPLDLAVIDLQTAVDALDVIRGEAVKTDVLDSVFSMFCIGK
jgi:tRNA modification GTPase